MLGEKRCQIGRRGDTALGDDAGNQSRRRDVERRIGHLGALIDDAYRHGIAVGADAG